MQQFRATSYSAFIPTSIKEKSLPEYLYRQEGFTVTVIFGKMFEYYFNIK